MLLRTKEVLLRKFLYFAWSISLNRKKIWLIICLTMFIKMFNKSVQSGKMI